MLAPRFAKLARSKAVLAAMIATFALGGAGTALALVGSGTESIPRPRPSGLPQRASIGTSTDMAAADRVAETSDPAAFAVSVAQVLFAWDTTGSTPLNEYAGRLLAVADPSGEESAGLATDLTTYLPSPESWKDLKTYETRQWIDISSYNVPDDWDGAQENAKSPDIAAGTTAYTVTGLRRRSGIWQGKTAKTVDKVSFTIFMTCRPTYDACRLLRLSQLNNPLR
ncbi:cell wall protein [Nocardioides sp. YIM B13467]|uniref:cell wall protein n=1 Tax=Nocardioides sp. YIM B13467 TaxID=3366294 RepID=UPI00366C864D